MPEDRISIAEQERKRTKRKKYNQTLATRRVGGSSGLLQAPRS